MYGCCLTFSRGLNEVSELTSTFQETQASKEALVQHFGNGQNTTGKALGDSSCVIIINLFSKV